MSQPHEPSAPAPSSTGPTDEERKALARAKRLANLKPFKKGQSGNPKGLPKGYWDKARKAAEEADPFRYLIDTVNGKNPKATEDIRFRAAQEILNRAYGKPLDTQVQLRIGDSSGDQAAQLGDALESIARLLSSDPVGALPAGETIDGELVTEAVTVEPADDANDP